MGHQPFGLSFHPFARLPGLQRSGDDGDRARIVLATHGRLRLGAYKGRTRGHHDN